MDVGRGRRPWPKAAAVGRGLRLAAASFNRITAYVVDDGLQRIAWIIRITELRIIVGPVRICKCPGPFFMNFRDIFRLRF